MKAYDIPIKVTAEGKIELPKFVLDQLPTDQPVRAIILVSEPGDGEEDAAWEQLTATQFLAGYGEEDAVYDEM